MGWLNAVRRSGMWARVGPMIPAGIRRMGVAMTQSPVARKGVDMAPVIEYLRPLQQGQTKALTNLLGRDFPEWKSLYGG